MILVVMGEYPQTCMIKARIAQRSCAPAMLHPFGILQRGIVGKSELAVGPAGKLSGFCAVYTRLQERIIVLLYTMIFDKSPEKGIILTYSKGAAGKPAAPFLLSAGLLLITKTLDKEVWIL